MLEGKTGARRNVDILFDNMVAELNQRAIDEMHEELMRLLDDKKEIENRIAQLNRQMQGLKGGKKL